jgi:hypothetical protein
VKIEGPMEKTLAMSRVGSPEVLAVPGRGGEMYVQFSANSEDSRSQQDARKDRIVVARSLEEVEAIRDVWTSWQWNPNADIDFYLQVLRLRPEIVRPHVLVLYRDNAPIAMLVGRLVMGKVEARLGYASLFRAQARTLTFIQGGQAGDMSAENSGLLIAEIMRSLRMGEADLADFRFVRTDSPLYQVLAGHPGLFMRDRFPRTQPHWKLILPNKVEDLYGRFTSKGRKNLRWQAKKLTEEFSGRITCFRRPEELDRMFHDVEEVASKTYHRGLGVGFVDNAEMRERMQLEAEQGRLRAHVLYLADKPGAFWIGNMSGGRFFSDFLGYDGRWAKYSPGTFLMTKVLEGMCTEQIKEVDFGLGDADYKGRFGNCSWEDSSISIFAPSFTGLRINAFRTPTMLAERVVKNTLGKTQILARMKRLWRDRAKKAAQHESTSDLGAS